LKLFDEIDLGILSKLLIVLKQIDIGKLDQHEGSSEVSKLLKPIHVDSALRKAEQLVHWIKNMHGNKRCTLQHSLLNIFHDQSIMLPFKPISHAQVPLLVRYTVPQGASSIRSVIFPRVEPPTLNRMNE
jgi:hypothetical protein